MSSFGRSSSSFQELQEIDLGSRTTTSRPTSREQEDHFWQEVVKKKKNSVDKRNPPGFKKLSKLGEGGFGAVWDCELIKSGRCFAVKQLVKGPTSEAKRNVETGLNEQWFGRMWFDEGGSSRKMLGICEAMDPPTSEDGEGNGWLWKVNPSIYPGIR